jgi:PucR C-terminal helix-turn-helix domain
MSDQSVRAALAERLRERLPELQGAVATRIYAISDPRQVADPGYLHGLNEAVAAAIEYRLAVLEGGERQAPGVPAVLLAQARLDARDGVPLDTVLRRYFAGNALFGDFLVEEAERAEVANAALRPLLAAQATLGDRLITEVSAEHAREAKAALPLAERRAESVLRYADVAVLASIARDDLLATSLRRLYLEPLGRTRDGGRTARETLRAYFEAERNVSSTAAALGVDRRTVRNRLRAIEELLVRPLTGSLADLEIALRMDN